MFQHFKKIKVCDAIMGSGKSSSAINYMNSHPHDKFIYITPYLTEAERIKLSCPDLDFREPEKLYQYKFKKYTHTMALLEEGKNITSTHNMFLKYTEDTLKLIREKKYTLIVDEAVEVFRDTKVSTSDWELLNKVGWLKQGEDSAIIEIDSGEYQSGRMDDIINLSKGNRLIQLSENKEKLNYWMLSKELFESFESVFILTYMFECQSLRYYFYINNIEFDYIGISRNQNGDFLFSETMQYLPPYLKTLSSKINIFDNKKINAIGDDEYALSSNWLKKSKSKKDQCIEVLRKNIRNYFRNYFNHVPSDKRLWSIFSEGENFVKDRGFKSSFLAFNARASNDYQDKNILAYCVNIFIRPIEKFYFTSLGIPVLEDEYAVSNMVQWIWRSAIRNGEEIFIYIPSSRMRRLLEDWITDCECRYKEYEESLSDTSPTIEASSHQKNYGDCTN